MSTTSSSSVHPPFDAQSLDVSLTANDLIRSRDWYRDILGFTVDREYRREDRLFAVAMRAGSIRILLTQDDGSKGAERVKGDGFSLLFTTLQDVDAIAAFAKKAGASLDMEPSDVFGARIFRLRDPDGFKLGISSPRPAP